MLEYAAYAGEISIEVSGSISNGAPRITGLTGGGYVVTWTSDDPSDYGVYANVFSSSGVAIGSRFRVNLNTLGSQSDADVTALAGGGFVIAYHDSIALGPPDGGDAVVAQIYSASGVRQGAAFQLSTNEWPQYGVSVDALDNGGFVATWTDGSGGPDPDTLSTLAQQFNASGVKVGPEVRVPQLDRGDQYAQDVAGLHNGLFVAVWVDNGHKPGDPSEFGVAARLFDAAGVPVTDEFIVNTNGYLYQFGAEVSALESGGFVVTWYDESEMGGDDEAMSVKAQVFDGAGQRVGGEILVNTTTVSSQQNPTVTALPDGGFAISWWDFSIVDPDNPWGADTLVRLQVFDADGDKVGGELRVNTTDGPEGFPAITALANGDIVVAWSDPTGDEDATWLRAQTFRLQPLDPGTNDTLTGTPAVDQLSGRGGNDLLSGGAGNDRLYGGDGNDVLKGGAGNDILSGGLGVDTADYSDLRDTGVWVSLLAARYGGGSYGGAGEDSLRSIENLVGSRVNDELTGDAGANTIRGQSGNDLIWGEGGDDILYGDAGDDVLNGGEGRDILGGGAGHDTFAFTSLDGDVIKDWQAGEKIDFTEIGGGATLVLQTRYGRTFAGFDYDHDGQFDYGFIEIMSTTITTADFLT
jgi:Ca2+-binding RTX toxin-like protein